VTCIVAVRKGSEVWLAGDSAGVAGLDLMVRSDAKVGVRGEFAIGFTSSFRMGQLLLHKFEPPAPPEKSGALFGWMVTTFVDAVRDCLKAGGYVKVENGVETGGFFIACVRGRIFTVESDFQVGETPWSFAAIGCGWAYALGALHRITARQYRPRDAALDALAVAEQFSAGVRGPFTAVKAP
jgi:ATP-dependent protease HslVU (ClpYQ) peptidase subunit